ncbi:MAG: hypothetical protein K6A67_01275 [Bacteroidales bacterium]|nr:hypothetical protein [Bacteroidales bacterium]
MSRAMKDSGIPWIGETPKNWGTDAIGSLYSLSLSASAFGELWVIVPILTEQHQIADYLDNKCAEIDNLIAIKQQKIEDLKDYKKSIIYEYVTGKKECIF